MQTIAGPGLWIAFLALVLGLLALDLGVFHKHAHTVRVREALLWSAAWILLSLGFAVGVHFWFGPERALEFLTGYVVEKALSVDNLFVMLVLFAYFRVPDALQHRVLFWGILGALVMRGAFVVVGAALIQRFHAVMYVFGAILIYAGYKLLRQGDTEVDPAKNPMLRAFRRLVPTTEEYDGPAFSVRSGGKRKATPLLAVLVAVESTDVVFAVDSIPAIFAITTDPFIVFTSNVFAILGLRSLYFVLAGTLAKFRFLNVGLSLVLGFVGAKMLLVDVVKIPIGVSLGVIVFLLGASIVASLVWPPSPSRSTAE